MEKKLKIVPIIQFVVLSGLDEFLLQFSIAINGNLDVYEKPWEVVTYKPQTPLV